MSFIFLCRGKRCIRVLDLFLLIFPYETKCSPECKQLQVPKCSPSVIVKQNSQMPYKVMQLQLYIITFLISGGSSADIGQTVIYSNLQLTAE